MTKNILRIDASARIQGSVSRDLTERVVTRFQAAGPVSVVVRNLAESLPMIDETWISANFTAQAERTPEQVESLKLSDSLVAELVAADVIVIGMPMYNFGIPASLKAWIDQIARAGITFSYTENGPVGLLNGKRVILALATGGTEMDSAIDFATGYMRHILGFIGLTEVEVVHADMLMAQESAVITAYDAVAALQIAA